MFPLLLQTIISNQMRPQRLRGANASLQWLLRMHAQCRYKYKLQSNKWKLENREYLRIIKIRENSHSWSVIWFKQSTCIQKYIRLRHARGVHACHHKPEAEAIWWRPHHISCCQNSWMSQRAKFVTHSPRHRRDQGPHLMQCDLGIPRKLNRKQELNPFSRFCTLRRRRVTDWLNYTCCAFMAKHRAVVHKIT